MHIVEATDGSDRVHVEANLSVGRLGVLGQIDGRLCGFAGGKEGAGGSGGPMVTPAGGGGGGFPWRMAALQPVTKSL